MSTFQPPIHLDPTQDPGQQTAFINQNFQTLASALETNSFRVVVNSVYTTTNAFTTTSTPTGGHVTESFNHNLDFTPVVLAYILSSGSYFQLPFTLFSETATYTVSSISASTDSAKVHFTLSTSNQGSNWGNIPIQYYLLQQSAS